AILQLYDSQQFISDYLPANQDIFDKFLLEYPELYNNNFIAENPISFLKNLYTYINTNEKGEEWLIDLYERSKITDESLNNIILKEETDFIPSRSTAVDTSLVDKKVLGFLENTYDSRFLAEIFDHLEKRGENRPGLLHAQIFNKSEEIPKAGPRVSFNPKIGRASCRERVYISGVAAARRLSSTERTR